MSAVKTIEKTTRSLWNYYRDEPNDFPANNYNANPITNPDHLNTKALIKEIQGNTGHGNTKTKTNLEIVVPLKYLSNFWRSLDMEQLKEII